MWQRKRRLKKEKGKNNIKLAFTALILFMVLIVAIDFLYLNFSFGKSAYINPISKATSADTKLSSLENQLYKDKILYTNVVASSDGSFVISLSGGGEVILSSKKDIGSQLTSLQLILSRLTIEGNKLKILDFRYDNPVVSF